MTYSLQKIKSALQITHYNIIFTQIKIGAIIKIEFLLSKTKRKKLTFTGICIAKIKSDTLVLRNVISGVAVEETFKLFSPLLIDIKIVKKPRKLFKSGKLYFLRQKPLKRSTFRKKSYNE